MLSNYYLSHYISKILQSDTGAVIIDSDLVRVISPFVTSLSLESDYLNLFSFLKWDFRTNFDSLVDLWAVDYLTSNIKSSSSRFEVNYKFNSLHNSVISLVCSLYSPDSLHYIMPSVSNLFSSSPWLEREVWDMFGLYFSGNNDMRKLLSDYGFVGHPFRKDFPLTGYLELRYDESSNMVVYEPVSLSQAYRDFSYVSSQAWSELLKT